MTDHYKKMADDLKGVKVGAKKESALAKRVRAAEATGAAERQAHILDNPEVYGLMRGPVALGDTGNELASTAYKDGWEAAKKRAAEDVSELFSDFSTIAKTVILSINAIRPNS